MVARDAEDMLLRLSARAGAFTLLDTPSKIEVIALGSFSCCMLGSLSNSFPLAANLAVALLALVACRARSEAQLAGLCGFCLFTTITDIINLCVRPSGWGGTMTIVNIFLKLSLATQAYRLSDALSAFAIDDELPAAPGDGGAGGTPGSSSGGYPTAYHAPALEEADYDSLAAERAAKHEGGEGVTRYRAI